MSSPRSGPSARAPLDLPPEEFGRRLKAARSYGRLTLVDLAAAGRIDRKRLQAIELGQRRLRLGEQDAIAYAVVEACGLPEGWIAWAFSEGGTDHVVLDELHSLGTRLDDLAGLVEYGLGLRKRAAAAEGERDGEDAPPARTPARR